MQTLYPKSRGEESGDLHSPNPYTVQQALRVQWRVFGVFVCFDLYFVNYRTWQAEILQERAEGCISKRKSVKIKIMHFYFVVL